MKRRVLLFLVIALPLLLAGGMVAWRGGEDAILRAARGELERKNLDRAAAILEPIRKRPLLSAEGKRQAAAMFFQLGEDHKAHTLLVGQRFVGEDAEDRNLKELSARSQRVALLFQKAQRLKDPQEEFRLAQEARKELPDSPRVLQWVVLAGVHAQASARNPRQAGELEQEYLTAYAELRDKAPNTAAETRKQLEAELAHSTGATLQ